MWMQDFVDCIETSTLDKPRFEEALSIKERHLPPCIYRYRRDCSNSRRNLETSTVWLSSPESYNDPYDCYLTFSHDELSAALGDRLLDALTKHGSLQGVPAQQIENAKRSRDPLEAIAAHIPDEGGAEGKVKQRVALVSTQAQALLKGACSEIQQWRKLTKLCSFSEINNSLLMWSHYADNHRGFCLEYDLEGLPAEHRLRENLYPVIYSSKIYSLTSWALTLASPDRGKFNAETPILSVIHKCDDWKYEREWRMVRVTPTEEPDQNCPAPTPARVFLGSRMDADNIKELREICSYRGIQVWQMHLTEDKFELSPERLT